VNIWIINESGQLLVQKRSSKKDSDPNKWDISSAGHIPAGETSVNAAAREIEEELGIEIEKSDLKFLFTSVSKSIKNNGIFINNSFHDVYLLKMDLDITKLELQEDEVSAVKWIDPSELTTRAKNQVIGVCFTRRRISKIDKISH
jgi:isopentenyldiphosphate isomerase